MMLLQLSVGSNIKHIRSESIYPQVYVDFLWVVIINLVLLDIQRSDYKRLSLVLIYTSADISITPGYFAFKIWVLLSQHVLTNVITRKSSVSFSYGDISLVAINLIPMT